MEPHQEPLITVLIPLYNGIEFLEDAVLSVKRQTFTRWVGIIGVNGHGADDNKIVVKVKTILNKLGLNQIFSVVNMAEANGAVQAINDMVGITKTEYVAHLDADDAWLSKKLEYQMKVVEKYPQTGIVGTWCKYFGDRNSSPNLPGKWLYRNDFSKINPLIHSSVLIRRELAVYSEESFGVYDYDCWVRNMLDNIPIYNIDIVLTLHRIHSKSFFNTSGNQFPELLRQKYNLVHSESDL